jgi:hypothetical protein
VRDEGLADRVEVSADVRHGIHGDASELNPRGLRSLPPREVAIASRRDSKKALFSRPPAAETRRVRKRARRSRNGRASLSYHENPTRRREVTLSPARKHDSAHVSHVYPRDRRSTRRRRRRCRGVRKFIAPLALWRFSFGAPETSDATRLGVARFPPLRRSRLPPPFHPNARRTRARRSASSASARRTGRRS